jgi:endonuclease YncB( thermonuclease family)
MKTRLLLTLAVGLILSPALVSGNTLIVQDVLSGGIIVFERNGFTARLTGLDVPDLDHKLGMEIWDFTKREVHGKRVKVFTWTTNNLASGIVHDEEGYPFVVIQYGRDGSKDLNEMLLRKGYARVDHNHLPDHLVHYLDIEKQAQEQKIGIWKTDQTE